MAGRIGSGERRADQPERCGQEHEEQSGEALKLDHQQRQHRQHHDGEEGEQRSVPLVGFLNGAADSRQ